MQIKDVIVDIWSACLVALFLIDVVMATVVLIESLHR